MSYQQPSSNPYGQQPAGNDPYGQQSATPYGQPSAPGYTQPANPYGASGDPYSQASSTPYGQPSAAPYGQSATPYGQPSADPYAAPQGGSYPAQPSQSYGATGGYGQSAPATGYSQQTTTDPYAAAGYADPYAPQAYGQTGYGPTGYGEAGYGQTGTEAYGYAQGAYGTGMEPYGYGQVAPARPSMGFGQALKAFFQNLMMVKGRASRSEFLWPWVISLVLGVVFAVPYLSFIASDGANDIAALLTFLFGLLSFVWGLGMIPLTVRRLHDTNKSGWWWLLSLLGGIGSLIVLIFCLQGSDLGGTRFDDPSGRQPKTGE